MDVKVKKIKKNRANVWVNQKQAILLQNKFLKEIQ